MLATFPLNRIGYDSPPAALPEVPKSARARGELWSETVFQAILALRGQLVHRDASVAAAAANSILELERTRLRHSAVIAGSEEVSDEQLEFEADERESRESLGRRTAAAREARERAAPAPVAAPTDERALAEHIEEVEKAFRGAGRTLPVSTEVFVRDLLEHWGLAAKAIPKGGFGKQLRIRGVGAPAAEEHDLLSTRV